MDYDVTLTTTNVPPTALLSHTDWIRTLSRHLVRDAAAADDLTQETLLAALRGEPRNPARLRPWLAGIARNLARQEGKKTRLRSDREADRALSSLDNQEVPSHSATLAKAEAHRTLVEHVLDMPEPSRSLLLQRYFEDRRPAEIAAAEGISPAAVHAKLTRAHGALRKRLEQTGGKEEWLATVGLLLLPEAGKKAAAAASSAPSTAASTAGSTNAAAAAASEASTVGSKALAVAAYGAGALVLLITAAFTVFMLRGTGQTEPGGAPDRPSRESELRDSRSRELARVETIQRKTPRESAPTPAIPKKAPREAPQQAAAPEPPTPDEVAAPVVVTDLVDIHGQCLDEDGRPIANAEVALLRAIDGRPEYWNDSSAKRVQDRTWTDSNGRFAYSSVPRGVYVAGLVPSADDGTSWLTPFDLPSMKKKRRYEFDVKVPVAHWIEGRIDLSASTGDGETRLSAFRIDVAAQAQTTAGTDGRFRFGPLHAGVHTITSITESPASIAIPPTTVEPVTSIEGTEHLVTIAAAPYIRKLSGVVLFSDRDENEPRAGRVLIGTAKILEMAEEENDLVWIAEASVAADGSYSVQGIIDGYYFVVYESLSGHRVAYEPVRFHDEDPSIPDLDLNLAEVRAALVELTLFEELAIAQPALVAWVHGKKRLRGGTGEVAVEVKGFSKGIPGAEELRLKYPISPLGSARIVVPLKSKLELRDERGRHRARWKTSRAKAGEVVVLD